MMVPIIQSADSYPGGTLVRQLSDPGISNTHPAVRKPSTREMVAICSGRCCVIGTG